MVVPNYLFIFFRQLFTHKQVRIETEKCVYWVPVSDEGIHSTHSASQVLPGVPFERPCFALRAGITHDLRGVGTKHRVSPL